METSTLSSTILHPGDALGIMGGGQLGRMIALAARAMGFRVHVLTSELDSPAGQVADRVFLGDWRDEAIVASFAQSVRAATYEFENVPAEAARGVCERTPVFPSSDVLAVTQHRGQEKLFLRNAGVPTTPFEIVHSERQLAEAIDHIGVPAVFKSATLGYDGKSQFRIEDGEGVREAWEILGGRPGVLEAFVPLVHEFSVLVARDQARRISVFPVFENHHAKHVLDVSLAPARMPPDVQQQAINWATVIAERLDVVGLICVEYFFSDRGELLANELAPRPHNSGHLTIEACHTSQFEQLVRIMAGLPMGSTRMRSAAAMANLLGDLWPSQGVPDWAAALSDPDAKLHVYGKRQARPGRKMGHLTLQASTVEEARDRVVSARSRLQSARAS